MAKRHNVVARCGLMVIDLQSGDIVHWIQIQGVVRELYFEGFRQLSTELSALAETADPVADLWTLAAFGVLAYMISNVLHEGLGHGGVAWLSGAHRITVTSTYMDAGVDTRWILAAGTLGAITTVTAVTP